MTRTHLLATGLTGLGLLGLMASWACMPSVPIARAPIVLKATPVPTPRPSPAASASPAPSATPFDIAPRVGRTYVYTRSVPREALLAFEVEALGDGGATVTQRLTPTGQPEQVLRGIWVPRVNGAYWLGEGETPVARPLLGQDTGGGETYATTFEPLLATTVPLKVVPGPAGSEAKFTEVGILAASSTASETLRLTGVLR